MDETPAPEALDQRRRRLLFRATHRGTRENDILFGGFVSANLADFTAEDLGSLEELLEIPDPLLADWRRCRRNRQFFNAYGRRR
jgi:antitoxin CptB